MIDRPSERLRAHQRAGIGDAHVGLAEMDAVGAGGQRHVDAVVDDEGHAGRPEQGDQRPRLLDQRPRLRLRIAELHHGGAGGDRLAHGLDDAARAAERAVGDQIDREVESAARRHRRTAILARCASSVASIR